MALSSARADPVVRRRIPVPSVVSAVHQEMKDGAGEQEQVGDRAKNVRPVLFPQEEQGDRQKGAGPELDRDPPAPVSLFKCGAHEPAPS